MAGQKGRSGGAREGSGPKPGTGGGARPGAGRPPNSFTVKVGDQFYVGIQNGGIWTVTHIDRTHLTFTDSNGNITTLVR